MFLSGRLLHNASKSRTQTTDVSGTIPPSCCHAPATHDSGTAASGASHQGSEAAAVSVGSLSKPRGRYCGSLRCLQVKSTHGQPASNAQKPRRASFACMGGPMEPSSAAGRPEVESQSNLREIFSVIDRKPVVPSCMHSSTAEKEGRKAPQHVAFGGQEDPGAHHNQLAEHFGYNSGVRRGALKIGTDEMSASLVQPEDAATLSLLNALPSTYADNVLSRLPGVAAESPNAAVPLFAGEAPLPVRKSLCFCCRHEACSRLAPSLKHC